jgi:outer membrane protein W
MRVTHAALAIAGFLWLAIPAGAQTPALPISRLDAGGSIGWFNAGKSGLNDFHEDAQWYNRSLYAGASVGWYWTDNLKTEIEGGVSTKADLQVYQPVLINGRTTTVYSTYEFATDRVAIGQYYQFFRNSWVHPFVGAGIDFTWEHIEHYDDVFTQTTNPRTTFPERTDFLVRPYATFGLKAYLTPHGFFRTDMRFVADGHGIDEVTLRFGLGIDF